MDLAALTRLLGRAPGTDNLSPPTPEECEKLARIIEGKPHLVQKIADAFSSGRFGPATPAQREEKEAYMRQLESEGKVPAGKVLVRPEAGFVVKTFKMLLEGTVDDGVEERKRVEEVEEKTKVFVNIVSSDMLARPSPAAAAASGRGGGVMFTIPNVVGPPRNEKDKRGALVPTVDFCVHPDAVRLALSSSSLGGGGGGGREGGGGGFNDLLVQLALESATTLWQAEEDREAGRAGGKARRRRRRVDVDGEYIILKGCSYKVGKEPLTMLVDSKSLASLPPSLPPMVLPPPKNKATTAAATAATAAAEEEKARATEHLKRKLGKEKMDEEEEETKQAPHSPTSTDLKCASSPSTSPPSLASSPPSSSSPSSSSTVYALPDIKIIEQGGREGGREGVDLAAVMVMDAPASRLRARSSRPHSLLIKVALPEEGMEGGRERGWVEEDWSVGAAEKELLVESRIFKGGEGGREGGKEGGRKYVQVVKLPYPIQMEEEEGEGGREEGVMTARMVMEEGRERGAARLVMEVRLLVQKKEDEVVQLSQPVVVEEEEGKEEGKEGGKEGGREENEGRGGKHHERWVAPAPAGISSSIAGLSKEGKEGKEEEEEGHDSILPARKKVGVRNGGQPQEQEQQEQEQQEQQQRQEGELARQPDFDLTEEETHFSLFFPLPGIDRSSVQVNCGNSSSVNVSFSSSSPSSLSTSWSLSLPLPKPLDSSVGCKWQVSSENLWVSVPKKGMGKKEKEMLLTSPHIFAMCE
jgi:HSP20 family molecular chaperone IbpA